MKGYESDFHSDTITLVQFSGVRSPKALYKSGPVGTKTPDLWNHRLRTLSSTDYNPAYFQVEFVDYKRAEEEVERCGSEVTAKDTTSLDFSQPLPGTS